MATPWDVPGLVVWFDATDDLSIDMWDGPVTSLTDKAATAQTQGQRDALQFNTSRKPNHFVQLPGPGVEFDGLDDVLETTAVFGGDQLTIFAVIMPDEMDAGSYYGYDSALVRGNIDFSMSPVLELGVRVGYGVFNDVEDWHQEWYLKHVDFETAAYATAFYPSMAGEYMFLTARASGDSVTLRRNGGNQVLDNFGSGQLREPQMLTFLGAQTTDGSHAFPGWLKEIFWFDRALTDAELSSMHEYLATKHGILNEDGPVEPPPEPVPGWAQLDWDLPLENGGLPILDYKIERKRGTADYVLLAEFVTARTYVDQTAVGGDLFRVTARNANGYGGEAIVNERFRVTGF